MDPIVTTRVALDAIEIDVKFLRDRFLLEDHSINDTDVKVAQDAMKMNKQLVEALKKAADSGNANSDTDND